jgi:uncharacterized protein (DUF4213/DUF364 family)
VTVIEGLVRTLQDGSVLDVRVGAFWTAVVVEVAGLRQCGLASTLRDDDHHHSGRPAVRDAGLLTGRRARELAELARSGSALEAAIGMATINALLPRCEEQWTDLNAEEEIARHGTGKRVAVIGHFPFVARLQQGAASLWVLEQRPRGKDLPAEAASAVIPQADVLAISGTTLINHTFEGLMVLRRPDALVVVLGPTTPLSPVLFDFGVHILSGAVVVDIDAVLNVVSQGANFVQVHRQGVRLVTMGRG